MISYACLRLIKLIAMVTCSSAIAAAANPAEIKEAKLRVVVTNPKGYAATAAIVDANTCKWKGARKGMLGWISGGAKVDTVRVGMVDEQPPAHGILERTIAADEKIAIGPGFAVALIGFWKSVGAAASPLLRPGVTSAQPGSCSSPIFVPEVGKQYEVTLNMAPGTCEVTLNELSEADGEVLRTKIEGHQAVTFGPKLTGCN